MTPRGTTYETAGTANAGYLAPRIPHRYHGRDLDPGERMKCRCGQDRGAPIHRIPSPRAAREESER